MMVRLFQLYDSKENKIVEGFFSNKPAAKTKRRELNEFIDNKEIIRFKVVPGPDHHRYKDRKDGNKTTHPTR